MDRVIVNLGCGFSKLIGAINVDSESNCEPDIVWNLNETPWPFDNDSVDEIHAYHVFEHLPNWWQAFEECARILKLGGTVEIRTPDASSDSALSYRDHVQIFTPHTFHGGYQWGGKPFRHGTNAWARKVAGTVPLMYKYYYQVPFKKYNWMLTWCPWLLRFLAAHMRNFVWEQQFVFEKINPDRGA